MIIRGIEIKKCPLWGAKCPFGGGGSNLVTECPIKFGAYLSSRKEMT